MLTSQVTAHLIILYKLICGGEVYNNDIKMCEKDGMIKFTDLNSNKVIYLIIIKPELSVVNHHVRLTNQKGNSL